MSKYTDSPNNFKLVQANEQLPLSKQALMVFDMAMNRLGIPDHFHEFVRALSLASKWDSSADHIEISLGRLAAILTSTEEDRQRVLNRLKKNSPRFFDWQDNHPFTIVDRIMLREHTTHHKTKAKYQLLIYPIIERLWCLPILNEAGLKREVNREFKDYPITDKPTRKGRKRKPESDAAMMVRKGADVIESTGSAEAAGLYVFEALNLIESGENVKHIFSYVHKLIADNNEVIQSKSGE